MRNPLRQARARQKPRAQPCAHRRPRSQRQGFGTRRQSAGRTSSTRFPESPDNSPQLDLYRGLALAQLKRLPEARQAFEDGLERDPRQPRLLGGAWPASNTKIRKFSLAKKNLFRALAIQPDDAYASNFLASIYFQENNLEAALRYWNRVASRSSRIFSCAAPRASIPT